MFFLDQNVSNTCKAFSDQKVMRLSPLNLNKEKNWNKECWILQVVPSWGFFLPIWYIIVSQRMSHLCISFTQKVPVSYMV